MVAIIAQDLIPLLNHNLIIGVASGLDLPGGAVYPLAVPENIEPLAWKVFEAGSVGEAQQMADGEDQFAETEVSIRKLFANLGG